MEEFDVLESLGDFHSDDFVVQEIETETSFESDFSDEEKISGTLLQNEESISVFMEIRDLSLMSMCFNGILIGVLLCYLFAKFLNWRL